MKRFLVFLLSLGSCLLATAAQGDTLDIPVFEQVLMNTNPKEGQKSYWAKAAFPSPKVPIRKAWLEVRFACPDGLHCGEWDYLDFLFLHKKPKNNQDSSRVEIARLITPYGYRFSPDWEFSWRVDVTDFLPLLRDSVQFEYIHTGYENPDDRGWLVDVNLHLMEGPPAQSILGVQTLYQGAYPYGNPDKPFEDWVSSRTLTPPKGTQSGLFRILQTGHGMDTLQNCAEFCPQLRTVLLDGLEIHQQNIWKECGDNALFPQAGTWIFDRAGWCPGSLVEPTRIPLALPKKESHTLDLNMAEYHSYPDGATYWISGHVVWLGKIRAKNDVELVEILSPSQNPAFGRENPSCGGARIRIRNVGSEALRSLTVHYGAVAEMIFLWKGYLPSGEITEIFLPGPFACGKGDFWVELRNPNNQVDEWEGDNRSKANYFPPEVWPSDWVLTLRTNSEPQHNQWALVDGQYLPIQKSKNLSPNTTYRDTFHLQPGCYSFSLSDTAGDGLEFWYNSEGGRGWVRATDLQGHLIKSWNSDFGSQVFQSFTVGEEPNYAFQPDQIGVFPVRCTGKLTLDYFFNQTQPDVAVQILDADSRLVAERWLEQAKEGLVEMELGHLSEGVYTVQVQAGASVLTKRFRRVAE